MSAPITSACSRRVAEKSARDDRTRFLPSQRGDHREPDRPAADDEGHVGLPERGGARVVHPHGDGLGQCRDIRIERRGHRAEQRLAQQHELAEATRVLVRQPDAEHASLTEHHGGRRDPRPDASADVPNPGRSRRSPRSTRGRGRAAGRDPCERVRPRRPTIRRARARGASTWRSEAQTPHASVRTSTSPGPGTGSGTFPTSMAPERMKAAFIPSPLVGRSRASRPSRRVAPRVPGSTVDAPQRAEIARAEGGTVPEGSRRRASIATIARTSPICS